MDARLAPLQRPTSPDWVACALANLDAVLADHLHCERKAAQSALSLVRSYPRQTELVAAVARLAHEETSHVIVVSKAMAQRGIDPGYDHGDDYASLLRRHERKDEPGRMLDRLLVFGLIEARSAERLGLLATALQAQQHELGAMYASLARAELRHRDMFLRLAAAAAPDGWEQRCAQLAAREGEIIAAHPLRPRIH